MFKHIFHDFYNQSWEFFSQHDRQVSGVLLFFSAFYKTFLFGMVIADLGVIIGIGAALVSTMAKAQEIYYKYLTFKKKIKEEETEDEDLKETK